MAAADGKDTENAERRYNNAFGLAEELPHRVDQAQVRYWYARMLLNREDADDKDRAQQLLNEARALSDKMGMGGLIARIDALRREPVFKLVKSNHRHADFQSEIRETNLR